MSDDELLKLLEEVPPEEWSAEQIEALAARWADAPELRSALASLAAEGLFGTTESAATNDPASTARVVVLPSVAPGMTGVTLIGAF